MTMLEQVFNKKILERIDRYRREHGIRTRKAAIEAMEVAAVPLEDTASEHPLTRKLRLAMEHPSGEKNSEQVRRDIADVQEQQKNGTLETVTHAEMMEELRQRKNTRSR